MPSSRLILCEKTARWAPALRAALGDSRLQLVETRSIPGCEEALAASPASFIAIEVTIANLDATLDLVRRIKAHYANAVVVALCPTDALAAAPLLREAGVIDVAVSVLEAPRLARLARRHHQQAPADPLTPREFVAERLPWPAHATK
jgi:DNA-binding NtrC family response regulator